MRDAETYDVGAHGAMLRDEVRLDAYVRALEATVRPGDVVVDVGTGTGVLALVACTLGASRVYALEPGDVIELAREAVRDNGFEDRVRLVQENSTRVDLDTRADVVVSDLRGVLPLFRRHLPTVVDARERFLAPGGRLVPEGDDLWMAPAAASSAYERLTAPWDRRPRGVDLTAGRRLVTHRWCQVHARTDDLLATPRRWGALDYERLDDPDAGGEAEWVMERSATAHGVLVWFDARLTADVGFSNAPGAPEVIYGQAFFPWPEALDIEAGDRLEVSLRADLVGEDYVWRWETRLRGAEGTGVKAAFGQATLEGLPLPARRLRRREADHAPVPGRAGLLTRTALELMDGSRTLDEIAGRLRDRFPGDFASRAEALGFAADLSEEYGAGAGEGEHDEG